MPLSNSAYPELARHIDSSTLFQSLNTPYIVFGVDDPDFTILEENAAHAKVAMVERSKTVGRPLFDVFPDTSDAYVETGHSELLESIRKVIRTGKPDQMPNLSYNIKDQTGTFKEKFWSVTHHPVTGKSGKVIAVYQETKDITEEVSVGRKLRRTERQLSQLLASSMIGTYEWSMSDDRVYGDTNLAQIFGFTEESAANGLSLKRFISAIHPDDREHVQQMIDDSIATDKPYESEYRVKAGDRIRWVIARGYVERDESGAPQSFSGVVVDITDRKEIERALADNESQLSFMADSLPQLMWIARPDGYHEYYNQKWYDYTGTKENDVDGEKWVNIFHPADRAQAKQAWQSSLKSGEPYEIEYRLFHAPTKTYRWVIGRALPFCDKSGGITKWYGTCTDIDEQKRAAQTQAFLGNVSKELAAASLHQESLLKKIASICVPAVADWCSVDLYDPKHGFTQVSIAHADSKKTQLAREYREQNPIHIDQPTGLAAVVRKGKSEYYPHITNEMLAEVIPEKDKLAFMQSLNLRSIIVAPLKIKDKVVGGISFVASDSGRHYTEADLAMIEELSARVSLALTNSRLYEEAKKDLKRRHELEQELLAEKQKLELRVKERTKQLVVTNEGLLSEIAKRRQAEKELQKKSENLERSNRELEDFAYVASHDLQEPLRKIQAFSDLLMSEYQKQLGDGADYVSRMNAAASRMSTLIQDLLAFSRVTTKSSAKREVNLNEIVSDVLLDLDARVASVKGTVKVGKLPEVRADPTHMRQLFQNLIGNALKFHKEDEAPVVEISASSNEKYFEIYVKDNGIGFDEKYIDKIFSVFQRLHGRDSYDGTGIGLAVCRKIMERYDGSITAVSEKQKGSTFKVRMPRKKERKTI